MYKFLYIISLCIHVYIVTRRFCDISRCSMCIGDGPLCTFFDLCELRFCIKSVLLTCCSDLPAVLVAGSCKMLKFALARSLAIAPSGRVLAKICITQILPHSSCTVRITTFICSCGGSSSLNSMTHIVMEMDLRAYCLIYVNH